MSKIASLEGKINSVEKKLWHEANFIQVLGDPSKWEYTGEVVDCLRGAYCICGHAIRYRFLISYNGRIEGVGSECINHFQNINPEMFESLKLADEKLKKEIAEAKKKAHELELNTKIVPLKEEYDALLKVIRTRVVQLRKEGRYVDYDLYITVYRHKTKEFVRLGSYLKYLQTQVEYLKPLKDKMIEKYGIPQ